MRVLVATDKFKGTLSASAAAAAIGEVLGESHDIRLMPVADGGEGTAEVLAEALGGRRVSCGVQNPLGDPLEATFWLVHRDDGAGLAVMEMSSASGLVLIAEEDRDPWRASTCGTGQMLLAARGFGVDEVLLGIGGSATNDGGAGMAAAIGYRFIDAQGDEIDKIPEQLDKVDALFPDLAVDLPRVTVACDVRNPLLGANGATRVFGKQKGIGDEDIGRHEARLAHFADLVEAERGCDFRDTPGAGAAGGLGFGLMSFCDAELKPGFDLVAETIGLNAAIAGVDLVVTGEGRIDDQSLMGKAPGGVAERAREHGKPVVAFCGSVAASELLAQQFDGVYPLVEAAGDEEVAMTRATQQLKIRVAQALPLLERWAP